MRRGLLRRLAASSARRSTWPPALSHIAWRDVEYWCDENAGTRIPIASIADASVVELLNWIVYFVHTMVVSYNQCSAHDGFQLIAKQPLVRSLGTRAAQRQLPVDATVARFLQNHVYKHEDVTERNARDAAYAVRNRLFDEVTDLEEEIAVLERELAHLRRQRTEAEQALRAEHARQSIAGTARRLTRRGRTVVIETPSGGTGEH